MLQILMSACPGSFLGEIFDLRIFYMFKYSPLIVFEGKFVKKADKKTAQVIKRAEFFLPKYQGVANISETLRPW